MIVVVIEEYEGEGDGGIVEGELAKPPSGEHIDFREVVLGECATNELTCGELIGAFVAGDSVTQRSSYLAVIVAVVVLTDGIL